MEMRGMKGLIADAKRKESARIRRELLAWFYGERSEPERSEHFLAALDRIIPENG